MLLAFTLVSALNFSNQLQPLNHLLPQPRSWTYCEECHIDRRAFTGIRVLHVRTLNIPSMTSVRKQTVLLRCNLGKPWYNVTLSSEKEIFNYDISTIDGEYVRLARRPMYASSQKLKYVPGTVVGAVYTRDNKTSSLGNLKKQKKPYCNGTEIWKPLSPLISDRWDTYFQHTGYQNQTAELTIVTSLLRSPEVLDKTYPKNDKWTEYVSPIEPHNRKDLSELKDEDLYACPCA